MIVIYRYDASTKKLTGTDVVADDYELKENETTVVCPNGLYEPCFDEQAQTWKGITKEEWEAKHPQQPAQPTDGAQAMNALGLQVSSLTAENKQLKQSINQLGLQLAQVTMKDKKENGGN